MQISLSGPSSQTKFFLLAGLLTVSAVVLSVLPTLGLGGHQHWFLYLVASHRISLQDFISSILAILPWWVLQFIGKDGVVASLTWIFGWVSLNGFAAIGEAIAVLSATGIGGLIVAVIGLGAIG